MFDITLDRDARLLRIVLDGQWSDATMDAFDSELRTALGMLATCAGPTFCIVDATRYPVQTMAIAARHEALLEAIEPDMADYVATIVASALVKSQARRIYAGERRRMFDSEASAVAWFAEVDASAR